MTVTGVAEKTGPVPGFAMDFTARDEFGNPWDFNNEAMRRKASNIVESKAAVLLLVSPMFVACSRLQTLDIIKFRRG